ncbi:MAG TPA: formamidopyrimidine-DNA glycosylase [Acidimicrobiales bacterium]|nr:formamidopyrimidine-DNA glycosylase [Acidimicrobiales bacterium]
MSRGIGDRCLRVKTATIGGRNRRYRVTVPEILEVETYRKQAEKLLGRRVADVIADDDLYLKGSTNPETLCRALVGRRVAAVRRRGKLLLLDFEDPPATSGVAIRASESNGEDSSPVEAHSQTESEGVTLGIHFGMTGRLVVDGDVSIDRLLYTSGEHRPEYARFALLFEGGGELVVSDPRRLGRVELDPDESVLGPDAMELTREELVEALDDSRAALKSRLLDQSRIAGLGNLLVDDILWRAGLDPHRHAGSLEPGEIDRLLAAIRDSLDELGERGGSHTSELHAERHQGGHCPLDGAELRRDVIGGRTTYWCPLHQH